MADHLAQPLESASVLGPVAPLAIGLRVELPRAPSLAHHPARFFFGCSSAGTSVLAQGEVLRREASGAGVDRLLRSLSRPDQIEWLDEGADPPGPWLAAIAFDALAPLGPEWAGFAPARFILPSLLAWSERGRHFAAAFTAATHGESRASLWSRLEALRRSVAAQPEEALAPLVSRAPAFEAQLTARARADWDKLVASALEAIDSGELSKVVVARALDLTATAPIDAAALVRALASRHPTCRAFMLEGDGGAHFVGATPELLCSLNGRDLRTEAVAGSAPPAEASQLLGRPKDLREHRWVVDHLVRGLAPISESVSLPPGPGLRVLANVAHLVTPLAARLRAGAGPADVIAALHPTPAVCGEPAEPARRFLARHERFSRGLYAGLVGLVGERRTELCVALRCALVRGPSVRAFAGAGLVRGSVAADELRETTLKSAALLDALAAAGTTFERPS